VEQLIEIWETFLMQLDTEDGETFVPPAGVVASPSTPKGSAREEEREMPRESEDSGFAAGAEGRGLEE
jgi:sorting nexin-1/2